MRSFVIHLDRAHARKQQVDHILKHTPNSEILSACDGQQLTGDDAKKVYPGRTLFKPHYPFALSRGEVACFESHKAAWRAIIDSDCDAGLVLEDDVQIDADEFAKALDHASDNLDRFGMIQFQVRPIEPERAIPGLPMIVRPDVIPLRLSAQVISSSAAQKLLDVGAEIDRPVDCLVQMRWLTGVEIGCVTPSGVSDRTFETGGSTLQKKRSVWGEIKATVPRFLYRRAIKARSAKS